MRLRIEADVAILKVLKPRHLASSGEQRTPGCDDQIERQGEERLVGFGEQPSISSGHVYATLIEGVVDDDRKGAEVLGRVGLLEDRLNQKLVAPSWFHFLWASSGWPGSCQTPEAAATAR